MKKLLKFFKNFFCSTFYPTYCPSCSKVINGEDVFCSACRTKIMPLVTTEIKLEKKQKVKLYSISVYNSPLKKLILQKTIPHPAGSVKLGNLLNSYIIRKNIKFDLIVPVPLHWSRYAWRGFNQTEIIARQISKHHKVPIITALTRKKETLVQGILTLKERERNISQAFQLSKKTDRSLFHNKKILLVDDLCTTGTTLRWCSKQLFKLKPQEIIALTASRGTNLNH